MRTSTLIAITIILALLNFKAQASPFLNRSYEVSVTGSDESIEYLKLSADYKTLKSTKYCRGAFLPVGRGEWWCSESAKGKQTCTRTFQCARVSKSRSLVTESRRIKEEMKEVKYRVSGKHRIWVSKAPGTVSKRLRKYKNEKEPEDFSEVQYMGAGPIRGKVVQRKKKETQQDNEFKIAQSETKKAIEKKKERQYTALEEMEALYQEERKQTEVEREKALLGGPNWEFLMEKSTDDDTKFYTVVQKDKEDGSEEPLFKFLSFAGGLVKITDSSNSVATINVAWTPTVKFGRGSKWGLRGIIGVQQYQLPETTTTASEKFLITETEILLYRMLGRAYLEFGVGQQAWGGSVGESFQTMTGTLGYKFKRFQLAAMERIFVSYSSIAATESATALKLGVGFAF
ncbi:MAG: hypothetical protein EP319_12540 [Deltaproteobacteria bacterium]|nr:MAG: hypothetical protein EP319_12540 [Deltaproteobacteria bacterium]